MGKRLTTFIKAGNQYEAYVKSAYDHRIIIFIKEIKRASRLKDQPSFISTSERIFDPDKKLRKSIVSDEKITKKNLPKKTKNDRFYKLLSPSEESSKLFRFLIYPLNF